MVWTDTATCAEDIGRQKSVDGLHSLSSQPSEQGQLKTRQNAVQPTMEFEYLTTCVVVENIEQ